jgi:hypothetical protein
MSQVLGCRFTDGSRQVVRLTAGLDQDWHDLGGEWGFDGSGFLNYEIGARFQCRLRFAAKAPETWETLTKFPVSDYLTRLRFGNNVAMVYRANLAVDVPLDQAWRPGEDEPDQPTVYAYEPSLYVADTADGKIEYQLQMCVAVDGQTKKFVAHQYDWGQGFAWIGNQPA